MSLRAILSFLLFLVPATGIGQTTDAQTAPSTTVRDPQAVALANQALQALAPSIALSDITLQGTVTREAGSDFQRGTFTFEASGNGKSRVALNLDGGLQQEVRNGPFGYWTDPAGQQHSIPVHNSLTDAPWFFPALSLQALASDPQVSILYGGQEAREGVVLYHLRLFRTVPAQTPKMTAQIQRLSMADLYFDAASYLPLILDFQTHPDEDSNLEIPVEIQFGDYRLVVSVR